MKSNKEEIIQQGAEAIIIKSRELYPEKRFSDPKEMLSKKPMIIKRRIKKSYRLPKLDTKIRTRRTKAESKIITKLKEIINVPEIFKTEREDIFMEFIEGKKLSEHLENLDYKTICKQVGESLTKLHNQDIIHGDLTTSNMIYVNNNSKSNIKNSKTIKATHNIAKNNNKISDNKINKSKLCLIDFGLGFHSHKIEDKAVDIHLLKQALETKHYKIAEDCIKIILKNYTPDKYKLILERIPVIESRGRYKKK